MSNKGSPKIFRSKKFFSDIFRSLCQKVDIAVIEFAPKDEVLSLASEANILPLTGKNYFTPKQVHFVDNATLFLFYNILDYPVYFC